MDEKFLAKITDKSSEENFSAYTDGYVKGKTLQDRGMKVAPIKVEAYLNIDSGTLSPYRHGEVFVLDDGTETDMDLGSYERFLNMNLSKDSFITHGQVYQRIIAKERKGLYNGRDVQYIPSIV